MIEVQAPNEIKNFILPRVFLAGSIEMGKAEGWQKKVIEAFEDLDVVVLNPRRDDWDSTWPQDKNFAPFRDQVEWELSMIEDSDIVVMYFDPATQSPITLLELGILSSSRIVPTVVCCPDGFWKKGNVDIVCEFYSIDQVDSLDELISEARTMVLEK